MCYDGMLSGLTRTRETKDAEAHFWDESVINNWFECCYLYASYWLNLACNGLGDAQVDLSRRMSLIKGSLELRFRMQGYKIIFNCAILIKLNLNIMLIL